MATKYVIPGKDSQGRVNRVRDPGPTKAVIPPEGCEIETNHPTVRMHFRDESLFEVSESDAGALRAKAAELADKPEADRAAALASLRDEAIARSKAAKAKQVAESASEAAPPARAQRSPRAASPAGSE